MKTKDAPYQVRSPELHKLLRRLEQKGTARDSRPEGRVLTNQAGLRRASPSWALVERVVRALDCDANTYCCLTQPCGSYIQTLRGFNGYHLERRLIDGGGYVHLRACYPGGSSKPERLVKLAGGNSGELRDLLALEDVVDAFRDFYRDAIEVTLGWRPLDI